MKYAKKSGGYYIAFLLALTTGMRQGEIRGLRWRDVDFENGCVRITQTLSSDGKDLLLYTKTKSGSRTIDLPEETVTALKKRVYLKIRFHDMRHTHATLLLLQGVNPKIVLERFGHADVRITLDMYNHLLPSMQKDTALKFGKKLFEEDSEI
ncbi:site-specific integrase [Bacillus thuringiensis]|uniref:site-specific integrase n=1 Tax=Bacillus thuringiensis TaxID=1428 RepID=UPI003DA08395